MSTVTCEGRYGFTFETSRRCTAPAEFRVTGGCVHEHIATRNLCDIHADDSNWCLQCLEAGFPDVRKHVMKSEPLKSAVSL